MSWFGFEPSDEAQAVFRAAKARWDALLQWKIAEKVPEAKPTILWWSAFETAWTRGDTTFDDPSLDEPQDTIGAINAAVAGVNGAEAMAREHGYSASSKPVEGIDITQATGAGKVAEKIDEGAKWGEKKVGDFLDRIPWTTVGLSVAGGLIVVGMVGWFAAREAAPYLLPAATGVVLGTRRRAEDEDEDEEPEQEELLPEETET